MRRYIGVALVLIVCVGYTYVSAKKVRKDTDFKMEIQRQASEYEAKRKQIRESGGDKYEVRAALIKLDNAFSQKKAVMREKQKNKKRMKAKDGYTRRDERKYGQKEIERKRLEVMTRKH